MELSEEQKIKIQMSMNGIPTYGATTYRNWPKNIPYAIDRRLGEYVNVCLIKRTFKSRDELTRH